MPWSREQIRGFVGGADVLARDAQAQLAPVPEWLADGTYVPPTWAEQVGWIHVQERPALVAAWHRSVHRPGDAVALEVRSRLPGGDWHLVSCRYLNLLDQPDVGAVLIVHEDLGPTAAPVEDPEDEAGASWDAPTWIIQHLDPIGAVLRTEGMIEEVFGVPADALAGRNVLELLHPDDHDAAIGMWLEVVATPGATRTIRQRVLRADGVEVWLESTVMNQLDTTGAVVAVSHDVSVRQRQEASLRASEQAFRALAEGVPVAVFRADASGALTYANHRCEQLLAPCGDLSSLTDLATDGSLREPWRELVAGERPGLDADVACADGRTLRLRCQPVTGLGDAVVVGTVDDVSQELATAHELRSRAEIDALTGVANRPGFDRRAGEVLADSPGDAALVFVDLDDFKVVNDTWGHLVGDSVLIEVAVRLRNVVRPDDLVARYGGDEFVLLCSGIGPDDEAAVVARIEAALAEPIPVGDDVWGQRASVGIVRLAPGEAPADALRRADELMYAKKRSR